jgi:hypothetical protein
MKESVNVGAQAKDIWARTEKNHAWNERDGLTGRNVNACISRIDQRQCCGFCQGVANSLRADTANERDDT